MTLEPELLGDEQVPSHHRWLVWVLVAAVLLAGLALADDERAKAHESAALTSCEQRLRTASARAESRLGLLTNYLRPALSTGRGVQQLHLADLMAARADGVLPAVQRADRACRSVRVRPWHFALAERRAAATAYAGALVTLLQTLAAQGTARFHDDATLARLRAAAGAD